MPEEEKQTLDQGAENCREKVVSEDYRDFIYEMDMPFGMEMIAEERLCEQQIGFAYRTVYIHKLYTDPLTLERFSYGSIPKCYTLLDTEMLNQAGISQVQNYPTLKLMGEGVMIGIIDTGIDYQNPVFRNADGSTRIAAIWDQTIQDGNTPEGFLYGTEYTREQINEALRSENPLERRKPWHLCGKCGSGWRRYKCRIFRSGAQVYPWNRKTERSETISETVLLY